MPRLTIDKQSREYSQDKRLVLAIEEMGVNIGHRCGGNARCTTCRVEFISGEPEVMTRAEYEKLKDGGLLGQLRLSCQLTIMHDMEVRPLMTLETQPNWNDTGPAPDPEVKPEARWFSKAELEELGGASDERTV